MKILRVICFLLTLVFVNGPANRHKPPKPQLCKKCSCCCDGSSVANMFWIILWIALRMAWSFDMDSTLFIFWSSNEWLWIISKRAYLDSNVLNINFLFFFKLYEQKLAMHLHDWKNARKYNRPFGQVLIQDSRFIFIGCVFNKRGQYSQH